MTRMWLLLTLLALLAMPMACRAADGDKDGLQVKSEEMREDRDRSRDGRPSERTRMLWWMEQKTVCRMALFGSGAALLLLLSLWKVAKVALALLISVLWPAGAERSVEGWSSGTGWNCLLGIINVTALVAVVTVLMHPERPPGAYALGLLTLAGLLFVAVYGHIGLYRTVGSRLLDTEIGSGTSSWRTLLVGGAVFELGTCVPLAGQLLSLVVMVLAVGAATRALSRTPRALD